MSFYGMDTEQVRQSAEDLEQASRRLEGIIDDLHASISAVDWVGPDADSFRDSWQGTRQLAESTVLSELPRRSGELEEHAEEQDEASDDGGSALDAVMDWLGGVGSDIVDGISGVLGGIADGISGIAGGIADGIGGAVDWLQDSVSGLEWPSWSEVLVGGLHTGVKGLGALGNLLGIENSWGQDGTGYADAPRLVDPADSTHRPPGSLADIIHNTQETYGAEDGGRVSMTVVGEPPRGVIANIPGTEEWGPDAGDHPFDLTGNAALAGPGGTSAGTQATADAIAQLYADNGIPPGTPLMLNGHSQGGMVASSLAADERFAEQYNVTNVMTYGSPVDGFTPAEGVDQLNIQHGSDAVPRIDLGGTPLGLPFPLPGSGGDGTTVTLDSPGGPLSFGDNHSGDNYQQSVQEALQDPSSPLSQYQRDPSMAPFLEGDPDSVQHYESRVHREN